MSRFPGITAILLAGGIGRRMGKDKTHIKIAGVNILRYQYNQLSPLFNEIIISFNKNSKPPSLPLANMIPDEIAEKGPIMGIFSSLKHSSNDINFVMALDIPDINIPVIHQLIDLSKNYDIVVPSFKKDLYEPLFAVYHKKIIPIIEEQIEKGDLKIIDLFTRCSTKILELPDDSWYANLNTPADIRKYLSRSRD